MAAGTGHRKFQGCPIFIFSFPISSQPEWADRQTDRVRRETVTQLNQDYNPEIRDITSVFADQPANDKHCSVHPPPNPPCCFKEIDDYIGQAKDKSYDTLVHFGRRGLNVAATAAVMAATKVMQTLSLFCSHPEALRRVDVDMSAFACFFIISVLFLTEKQSFTSNCIACIRFFQLWMNEIRLQHPPNTFNV